MYKNRHVYKMQEVQHFSLVSPSVGGRRSFVALPIEEERVPVLYGTLWKKALPCKTAAALCSEKREAILSDIRHTFLVLCLFGCSLLLMCLGNSMADRLNLNNIRFQGDDRVTLPDPIMSLMGSISERIPITVPINDWSLMIVIFTSFAYTSLFARAPTFCTPFRRLFLVWSCMNCLRGICITLTVLTNPYLQCHSEPHPNIFLDALLLLTTRRQSCGDVFFSGHSVTCTLSCLMWLTYRRRTFSSSICKYFHHALALLFPMFVVSCLLTLIATQFHYSVDVFIGSFLSILMWQITHWLLGIDQLRLTPLGVLVNIIDGSPLPFIKAEMPMRDGL
jgi:hypothetical protein